MDPPFVYIEKEPFLVMILSVVETFRKESYGLLFGHKPTKKRNGYVVTCSMPIQLTKKRKNSELEQSNLSNANLNIGCIGKYPRLFRQVGSFHSHPEWGSHRGSAELSIADIQDSLNQGEPVTIVVNISSINKERILWEKIINGSIRGSLNDWKFSVNAWQVSGSQEDPCVKRLVIEAPAAIKSLNRALGYG